MYTPIIRRVCREQVEQAEGIVIAIDVIRAFTVAAYAFAGGASHLWLVRTVPEALALREYEPNALLAGEIEGRLIPGFDLNNSPYNISRADIRGCCLIQRTGAGTQGAVGARNATHVLVCALANARATAQYAAQLSEAEHLPITLLPTASSIADTEPNEDDYCADYLEALLTNPATADAIVAERVARLQEQGRFSYFNGLRGDDFPVEDEQFVLAVDRFDFVMVGTVASLAREGTDMAAVRYVEVRAVQPSKF